MPRPTTGMPQAPAASMSRLSHLAGQLGRDVDGLVREDRGRVGKQDEIVGHDDGTRGQVLLQGPRRVDGDNVPDSEGLQGREIGLVVDEVGQDVVAGVAIMAGNVGDLPGDPDGHPPELVDHVFLSQALEDAFPVQNRSRDDADGRHEYLNLAWMAQGLGQ